MRVRVSGASGALLVISCFSCCALVAQEAPPTGQQRQQTQEQQQQQQQSDQLGVRDGVKPIGDATATGVAAPVDPKTYKVGPGDVLLVRVWREPELSGQVQVRPDGKFTLPLVGELAAADLTPEQITQNITEGLSKFINKPEVMVSVQQILSKKFYITGGVNRTGTYPLVMPTNVLEALSNAGGFKEFANKKKIVIMRGTERLKFNYNDVVKGKKLEQNIQIQDGDHIFVPE
jgi:polysaccharide export outer membrane protein